MNGQVGHLLVVSPSWLGDVIMALPAFAAWRERHPAALVTVLAKPAVQPLWSLCEGVDEVVGLAPGLAGTARAIEEVRRRGCDAAVLLPNAFRAAWIAWRAGVPRRRGTPRQGRWPLLTERVSLSDLRDRHQACEAYRLFGLDVPEKLPRPHLSVLPGDAVRSAALAGLREDVVAVALLPGAARGPSKRWPAGHFVAAAERISASQPDVRFLVCGSAGEAESCRAVAAALGSRATDLSGRTRLPELAALLSQCRAVCCNDSGGMHLASAVGVPVVAVFGLTDPGKTGPLGPQACVVTLPGVRHARAIARRSARAARVLAAITPDRVANAVLERLAP